MGERYAGDIDTVGRIVGAPGATTTSCTINPDHNDQHGKEVVLELGLKSLNTGCATHGENNGDLYLQEQHGKEIVLELGLKCCCGYHEKR